MQYSILATHFVWVPYSSISLVLVSPRLAHTISAYALLLRQSFAIELDAARPVAASTELLGLRIATEAHFYSRRGASYSPTKTCLLTTTTSPHYPSPPARAQHCCLLYNCCHAHVNWCARDCAVRCRILVSRHIGGRYFGTFSTSSSPPSDRQDGRAALASSRASHLDCTAPCTTPVVTIHSRQSPLTLFGSDSYTHTDADTRRRDCRRAHRLCPLQSHAPRPVAAQYHVRRLAWRNNK